MTTTIGIDIGSGAVKTVLFRQEGGKTEWLAKRVERIRQRVAMELARASYDEVLEDDAAAPLGGTAGNLYCRVPATPGETGTPLYFCALLQAAALLLAVSHFRRERRARLRAQQR